MKEPHPLEPDIPLAEHSDDGDPPALPEDLKRSGARKLGRTFLGYNNVPSESDMAASEKSWPPVPATVQQMTQ